MTFKTVPVFGKDKMIFRTVPVFDSGACELEQRMRVQRAATAKAANLLYAFSGRCVYASHVFNKFSETLKVCNVK